jgi:hypothetical protein
MLPLPLEDFASANGQVPNVYINHQAIDYFCGRSFPFFSFLSFFFFLSFRKQGGKKGRHEPLIAISLSLSLFPRQSRMKFRLAVSQCKLLNLRTEQISFLAILARA